MMVLLKNATPARSNTRREGPNCIEIEAPGVQASAPNYEELQKQLQEIIQAQGS